MPTSWRTSVRGSDRLARRRECVPNFQELPVDCEPGLAMATRAPFAQPSRPTRQEWCVRDDMVRRDYAVTTIRSYVQIVDARFASTRVRASISPDGVQRLIASAKIFTTARCV